MYGDMVVLGGFALRSAADMVDVGVGEIAWMNFCEAYEWHKSYKMYKAEINYSMLGWGGQRKRSAQADSRF